MNIKEITTSETEKGKTGTVAGLLLCILLNGSFWFTVFSMTDFIGYGEGYAKPLTVILNLLLVAVPPIIIYFLSANKRIGRYLTFYVLMVSSVVLLAANKFSWQGILFFANSIIDAINEKNGMLIIPFNTGDPEKYEKARYLVTGILSLITSSVNANAVIRKDTVFATIMNSVPVIFLICFSLSPSVPVFVIFVLSVVALCVRAGIKKPLPMGHKNVRTVYIQGGKYPVLPLVVLSVTACFTVLFSFMLREYKPLRTVDTAKNKAEAAYEDTVYGSRVNYTPLPDGNLNNAVSVEYTDTPVLNLKMEHPGQVYLRTFVGESFEDGKWTTLPKTAYSGDYLGILEYLGLNDFYPFMQMSELYKMETERTGSAVKSSNLTVANIALKSDRLYIPYETNADEALTSKKVAATCVHASGIRGERSYTIGTYTPKYTDYGSANLKSWLGGLSECPGFDSYKENELIYRDFVYDNYLSISEKDKKTVNAAVTENLRGKDYRTVIAYIRTLFTENYKFSYDLSSEEGKGTGYEKDSLAKFSLGTKTGYDCYFASFAALILRNAGIPARYAEGYFLSEDDVSVYEDLTDVEFELYDSAAHSWVEVYVDGIGFVPVDVVPGYYTTENSDSETVARLNTVFKAKNDDYYYDDANSGDSNSPKDEDSENPYLILIILSVIVLFAVLAAVFGAFHKKRMKEALMVNDNKAAVRSAFDFYCRICRYLKEDIKTHPYEFISSKGEDYENFIKIVYEAEYSVSELSEDKRQYAVNYVLKTAQNTGKNLSAFKKIIYHLVTF